MANNKPKKRRKKMFALYRQMDCKSLHRKQWRVSWILFWVKIPEYNVDLVGSDSASINCFGLKAIEASGRVDCGHFLW
jgi:hypothetical protein